MSHRLTIVSSSRPAVLVERLAGDLAAEPLPPFERETIVVQSLGMERWVRNELARRHGCAASLDFPFPAGFCRALAARLAADGAALDERFGRDALTWRILELLESGIAEEPDFAPLRAFVHGGDTRKRLGLAARVAGRFDDYQLYRPAELLAWEVNESSGDAGPHVRWQAALWRRLCGLDGGPTQGAEPPRHLARWFTETIAALEARDTAPDGLPRRIGIFGVSTLPPLFLRLLRAAARFVPVRLYVLAPPRATWVGHDSPPNALHAAFGAASRELLSLCDSLGADQEEWDGVPDGGGDASCLRRLQDDFRRGIARGLEGAEQPPVPLADGDESLSVHVCHSPMREMEVLRDQLFAALAADPTLRPHDILLLVPDVAVYAPFVEAVFGVGEPELPRIPHHVADRPIAHESSLVRAALRILQLVGARWTAPEVMELLESPSVRRAAGISEEGSSRILDWVEETRIRWGRDGKMRRSVFELPGIESNSWRAGLDRLLMGYAVGPEEALVADVIPFAGQTIGDPATLGAFAHWIERLFDVLDDWRAPRPLAAWSAALDEVFSALLAPGDDDEADALRELLRSVADLRTLESLGGCGRSIDLVVVRDWLERKLSDESIGSGFLIGGMTVCAFKPMRAIPFRIIAMAGLDERSFPRPDRRAAYDLLEIEPRPGDRSLRADDRQLFLDTLLSARDRVILSYVGRSARDNTVCAASVVLAQLLGIVDRSFTRAPIDGEGPRRPSEALVVEHRLQPFSAAYYDGRTPRLFSYSRVNARALAAGAERRSATAFVDGPVAASAAQEAPIDIALADLVECWTNPSRFFCQSVLELRLPGEGEPLGDCEPMEVDGLTKYAVQEEMLRGHLAGARAIERKRAVERALGRLPSGALAGPSFDVLEGEVREFLERISRPSSREPAMVEIAGTGWRITGRLDGITDEGRLQLRAATVKNKDLIGGWIRHLALSAVRGAVRSTIVGTDRQMLFDFIDDPRALLETLVAGYRAALAAPLPVFERASHAYFMRLRAVESGKPVKKAPLEMARAAYEINPFAPGADLEDVYVVLCWRGRDPFAEPAEFERWSEALWRPAFDAMYDLSGAAEEVQA